MTMQRPARAFRAAPFALRPVAAALLLALPLFSPPRVDAADGAPSGGTAADGARLPDLGTRSTTPTQTRLYPSGNGIALDSNDADSRFTAHTEASQSTGGSVGIRGALTLGDAAALGAGMQIGAKTSELFLNLGLGLGPAQRLMFTGAQLRQNLGFNFPSGKARADITQNSAGASWRFKLGNGFLDYAEANVYAARSASRDLSDVSYAVDTAALYELWNDPRRIAGGSMAGLQGRLGVKPWDGGRVNLGFGQEMLRYDLLGGAERHNRPTGSLGLEQALDGQTRLKFGADVGAAQNRSSLGFDHRFGSLGTLGIDLVSIRGRDSAPSDNRVQLSWTIPLAKAAGGPSAMPGASPDRASAAVAMRPRKPDAARPSTGNEGLLDQVAMRPAWMPSQVIAKLDTSAGPVRLIAVDKTALPAGARVNATTGIITTPLGVAVAGIAGITRNAVAFANAGQFAVAGSSLVINPNLIVQPAVSVVDVYVVTLNNVGGGTTLVTVNVSHGSVRIDSIRVASGTAVAAAPAASAVSISGTAQVGQLLTGQYTYADANGDPQGTSTFRWLRGGVAIAGATASTYTPVAADQGNTITFEVTPVSTVAPTTGTPVVSSATGAVAGVGVAAAPTASNVAITGTAQVGQTLTGSYTYADANNDPQGTSAFRWLRGGSAIAGATASTYTLAGADQGNTITFEVTPVATVAPTTGTAVVSSATAVVAGVGAAAAPTAGAVSIAGTAQVGQLLTGSYTYTDVNNDPQGTSTFRWLRGGVAIAGATATTYTLVAADQGTTITFEVTPVATVAPTTGTPVASSATGAVAGVGVAAAPTASAVSISGTAQVGQLLTGSYTYAHTNNDPQGTSTFRWLRGGVAIAGATAMTYTLVAADQGNMIAFEVTPVSTVAPTTGTPVVSSATAAVAGVGVAAAPTASSVAIAGTAQVGQLLTGSYTYADANSDPQGTSTFRWLRGGVAIAGATASTYTLVAADQGNAIAFEVTPVSTVAPTTGTPVVSSATASVAGVGVAAAPTASTVSIGGVAQVGQQLTGSYTYADANNDPQGTSTFRWLRGGVAIAGATATTYTLVGADQGNTITFEVTPVSTVSPTTGTPVVSSATAAVAAAALPAGYVSQGGLTWTPNTIGSATFGTEGWTNWNTANTYCTTATINGQTGWRLPTTAELSALYTSGAMNGQGWPLITYTWSSTPHGAGNHEYIYLDIGYVFWRSDTNAGYVTCVR